MDSARFAEIVDLQTRLCKDVLVDKAREYATEDRLHNFKVAAELQGIDMLEALAGMMAKHTVSIYDMCGSEETFTAAQWDEKITDHINYLILLRAIVYEIQAEETETEESEGVFIIDELLGLHTRKINPYDELAAALSHIFNPNLNKTDGQPNA